MKAGKVFGMKALPAEIDVGVDRRKFFTVVYETLCPSLKTMSYKPHNITTAVSA